GMGSEAGLIDPVSSAPHHLGRCVDSLVSDHPHYWALGNTPFERQAAYQILLNQPLLRAERQQIKDAVLKSWPLGAPSFLATLSEQTSRRLTPLQRGRPRKP
ncbi:MAG TPA: hypothetical protein VE029_14185, partial [Rhizobacter sp.]|nr:hypothetical protein [Rhizobacter sp.]